MSEFESYQPDPDQEKPEEPAEDPVIQHELSREIVAEKLAAMKQQILDFKQHITDITAQSYDLDNHYPELGTKLSELYQLSSDLQNSLSNINPQHPDFEAILAQQNRIREMIDYEEGNDQIIPTARAILLKRIESLHEELEILNESYNALLRLKAGRPKGFTEKFSHQLYPTPGSKRN